MLISRKQKVRKENNYTPIFIQGTNYDYSF